jgi:hypothetical protein
MKSVKQRLKQVIARLKKAQKNGGLLETEKMEIEVELLSIAEQRLEDLKQERSSDENCKVV